MPREDWVWDHVTKAPGYDPKKGCKAWTCHFCELPHSGGPGRIKAHIGKLPGREIEVCPKPVTLAIYQRARQYWKISPSPEDARNAAFDALLGIVVWPAASAVSGEAASAGVSGGRGLSTNADSGRDSASVTAPPAPVDAAHAATPSVQAGKRLRTVTIQEGFNYDLATKLNDAVGRFFYLQRIPFNVVRSEAFKEMMQAQAVAGMGGFSRLLGYEKLRTTQLSAEVRSVDRRLEEFKQHWSEYGCTIVTDGWTDAKKRQIINFMACSVYGSVFLKAIDAGSATKTGNWLWNELRPVLLQVGPEKVVQVVTDNASNCVRMGELMREEFPQIIHGRCVCHVLDLLLEDIGKLDWASAVVKTSMDILTFITTRSKLLALFRDCCPQRELVKPCKTRFAYMFLVVCQLIDDDVFNGLKKMTVSDDWRSSSWRREAGGMELEETLFQSNYVREAKEMLVLVGPILKVLRMADREGATMGLIFEAMDRMNEGLEMLARDHIVDAERVNSVLDLIRAGPSSRWVMLHNIMQGAAHALNPMFLGKELDAEAHGNWNEYMHLYANGDFELECKLDDQFNKFRAGEGRSMGLPIARSLEKRKFPVSWWRSVGFDMLELKTLALRVLSQGISASPSERNWIAWSLIQIKSRNRLLPSNLKKLVHVYTNSRLLRRVEKEGKRLLEVDLDKLELEPEWQRIVDAQLKLDEEAVEVPEELDFVLDEIPEEEEGEEEPEEE